MTKWSNPIPPPYEEAAGRRGYTKERRRSVQYIASSFHCRKQNRGKGSPTEEEEGAKQSKTHTLSSEEEEVTEAYLF